MKQRYTISTSLSLCYFLKIFILSHVFLLLCKDCVVLYFLSFLLNLVLWPSLIRHYLLKSVSPLGRNVVVLPRRAMDINSMVDNITSDAGVPGWNSQSRHIFSFVFFLFNNSICVFQCIRPFLLSLLQIFLNSCTDIDII